jgi:uncharacterized protein
MIPLNVIGKPLQACCTQPATGFYRDGFCRTDRYDAGRHVICAKITQEFLQFTLQQGNDLITANEAYGFAGLKEGDIWCLCAIRWKEAHDAGKAPPVFIESCAKEALNFVELQTLLQYAIDK